MVRRLGGVLALACSAGCQLYSLQNECGPGYDGGACVIPTSSASGSSAGTTTSTTGSATSNGSSTTAGTTASTATTGAATSTTSGVATTGATTGTGSTTTSSTSGTTGPAACGPNMHWAGDVCVQDTCNPAPFGAPCVLMTGTATSMGACYGGNCLASNAFQSDNQSCGGYLVSCPDNSHCVQGVCADDTMGNTVSCPAYTCDGGTTCSTTWNGCVAGTCNQTGASLESPCDTDAGPGFCCGTNSCLPVQNSDPMNCGACGVVCPAGDVCNAGVCATPFPCATGENNLPCGSPGDSGICCQGSCVNVNNDSNNCHACGVACPAGSVCQNQSCVVPDAGDAGTVPGSCTSSNCPAFTDCPSMGYPFCVLSTCIPKFQGLYCGTGGICCGTTCASIDSDTQNCGGCGIACASREACVRGHCTSLPTSCSTTQDGTPCPSGSGTCCGGRCTDPQTDALNCNGCGLACPNTSSCVAGACQGGCATTGCSAPTVCANTGVCLSPRCTANGTACAYDGGYDIASSSDYIVQGACCNGACVNTTSDSQNCYGCGMACPAGDTCSGSFCGSPCLDAGSFCAIQCIDAGCSPGQACNPNYNRCLPTSCGGLNDGTECGFGPLVLGACCNGACVDTSQDPQSCGSCGARCPAGSYCSGTCVATAPSTDCLQTCPTGTECLNGGCLGSSCQGQNSYSPCAAANGTIGSCCGLACADFQTDPLNCGACGIVCGPGQTCSNGACSGSPTCTPGQREKFCGDGGPFACCNGVGCVDVFTDPNNCGRCGTVCAARMTCQGGFCGCARAWSGGAGAASGSTGGCSTTSTRPARGLRTRPPSRSSGARA